VDGSQSDFGGNGEKENRAGQVQNGKGRKKKNLILGKKGHALPSFETNGFREKKRAKRCNAAAKRRSAARPKKKTFTRKEKGDISTERWG